MRLWSVLLMFAACGGGTTAPSDPYATATCDHIWQQNGFDQCDAGCADSATALGATGAACSGMLATGSAFACVKTFDFHGVTGCCASDKPSVLFAECP
jgi:hypothetical protein